MNLLKHKAGRGLLAFAFYFAEGAPIGFIWWALPTYLRQNKVGVETIGTSLALLTLPWVLKFLWAPLIDRFRTEHFGFKKWIALSQVLMCVSLLPLVFIPFAGNIHWWIGFLLFHSLFAATQDVAVDAMMIKIVGTKDRGKLNGYMQAGMLFGRSLFGGGTLILIQNIGLRGTIITMILVILSILLLLTLFKEPETYVKREANALNFWVNLKKVFFSKQTLYTLLFALTSGAVFEAVGGMAGSFLTDKDLGMESIGLFLGIPVVICMLLGGLLGGFISDRMNRKKAATIFLFAVSLSVMLIAWLDVTKNHYPYQIWLTFFCCMYFFTGMFIASSYALFMDATNPEFGAVQFSTFMAATNCCEFWVVWSAGHIVASYGYGMAFIIMTAVSLFSLVFLFKNKMKIV
ncbi:MAG: MFS transporter [Bacteroidota bacterium]|nr:MFS transporter [Bacteroidota bacterium]